MLKYNFKELKKPIIIDEPAVQDIIILNNNKSVSVTVTTARGLDETKLEVNPGEDLRLTVQIGDVEGIRWGGTDNWGYYKLILPIGAEAGSVEYDSITVKDITVDPTGGVGAWCTCEKVYNGTDWVLKYTATEANPSTEPRYALFKHSTTDKIISRGDGAGRPAASEWWVTVMLEGSENPNPTPKPDPEPDPEPQPDPQPDPDPEPKDDIYTIRTSFDDLVLLFSEVIDKLIDEQNTPYTYGYLSSMYNTAESEWDDENSEFFDSKTYPDIYPYHGDNNEYETLSFNAMQMWIIASCLSELIPSFSDHGDGDNIQTKLFKFAYDFGKEDGFGNTIPLYNNYTIKGDPNIARLAASAIYCANHDNNQSEITQSREELHGNVIQDSGVNAGWDDLGYLNDKGTSKLDWRDSETNERTVRPMYTLGYNVNANSILPIAPGTRVIGYENQAGINVSTLAEQQGEQFFNEEYNYNTDVAIDEYITQNYNLYAGTGNVEDDWNTFSTQSDEVKNKVLVAAMIPACNDFMLFGEKTVEIPSENKIKYVDFYDPTLGNYPLHRYQFVESNQEPDNNTIFRVKGPFFDYENAMFVSEPTAQQDAQRTTMLMYMKQIMDIADNCRFPSMCNDYGRIRPLGDKSQYDAITRGETQYDPLSGFNCGNLGALFADTVESREYMQDDTRHDDWPLDSAKSYQSGHSAQGWAIALMLGQINPNRMITNMKHGYELGVLRTIGRYHWNSDVIYGRLCATMCIPIINAMSSLYQRLKASTNSSANPVISIGLRITNNCGEPVTLDGDVKFTLGNPDHNGNYLGWEGVYNGTSHITFSDVPVTLENGETLTFYNVTWIDEETGYGMGGKSPADAEQLAISGRPRNILFYANGISEKYLCDNMDPQIEFENGNVYDVNITYADPNI